MKAVENPEQHHFSRFSDELYFAPCTDEPFIRHLTCLGLNGQKIELPFHDDHDPISKIYETYY